MLFIARWTRATSMISEILLLDRVWAAPTVSVGFGWQLVVLMISMSSSILLVGVLTSLVGRFFLFCSLLQILM